MGSGCCIALEPGCGKLCLRRFRRYRIADASWRELLPNSVPLHAKTQSEGMQPIGLRDLRYCVEVARRQGFSAAPARLSVRN